MRILFLSNWYPYPADNGSKIRIYNLLQRLARHHDVTLLSFTGDDFEPEMIAPLRPVCSIIRTAPRIAFQPKRWKAVMGFASTRPRSLVDTFSRPMMQFVRDELATGTYDVVIASQLPMAPYVEHYTGIPKIFEEVEVGIYRGGIQMATGLDLYKRRLTWAKSSWFLRRLLAHFDAATVASQVEKEALVEIGVEARRVTVIPNAIDVGACRAAGAIPQSDSLIFNGALTYSANYDAMRFFLDEVYPLIRARRPQVQLAITGRTEGVPLEALPFAERVTFTGYLPDVRPAVASSWASIAPLRQGGGTRLKILEAMALGTPVIATSKGAEGLEVRPGENILIADDAADFAAHTLQVLENPMQRARLAANARELVWSKYDVRVVGELFESLVEETVERRRIRLAMA